MVPAIRQRTPASAFEVHWVCECGRFSPVLSMSSLGAWVASATALACVAKAPINLPSGVLDTAGVIEDVQAARSAVESGKKLICL